MHLNITNRLENLHNEMRKCRQCLEQGYQITPGAIFSGGTSAKVMVIGQAPGVTEVEAKRPFNAGSGRRLFLWLEAAGWNEDDFRKRHYMTAVTKCYPGKNNSGRGDRVPSKPEQTLCRPFLEREIGLLNPQLIIPIGGLAIKLFFPRNLKLNQIIGSAAYLPATTRENGPFIDPRQASILDKYDDTMLSGGRWVVPLPHPSGASVWPNQPQNKDLIDKAIALLSDIRLEFGL